MTTVKDVIVIGAGGFARELLWLFEEINADARSWNVLGFVDNDPALKATEPCGVPVLGDDEWLIAHAPKSAKLICGTGSPRVRRKVADKFAVAGFEFATVVHPTARMSKFVELGAGTIVTAGDILTTQIRIGAHCLLNLDCTIGHDCTLGDYCVVSPGAHISGAVTLGKGVEIGTGACIIQGKSIGEWSVIGAGSVVVSDLPAHVTAVGVPCKVIKTHPV
jgi:sugar O-acyltransferase (sialic acid O-acetyltransferase NeuD family)